MRPGSDIKAVFALFCKGILAIEDGVKSLTETSEAFKTHPIFGAINTCPSNIGTAMRVSVHIALPKLLASWGFNKINDECLKRHCQARGSDGEKSSVVDRIDISNHRRCGFTEVQLIEDMIKCVNATLDGLLACPDKSKYASFVLGK